ncbi:MAG: glycosyltransferase family 39 protein [Thermoanaerobaculia bacterium]|nr:glycosyltransferase family 39 protein [Thermoanaerobaculia bacterium]
MTASRERRVLFLVLTLALLLRLMHWVAVREAPFVGSLVMDSEEYDRWAREIAGGEWLGSEPFFQAPLYPYLLAVVYAVVGIASAARLDAVYLLQIVLAVAGCWALYRAGRLLGGSRLGLAAAGLAAVYGPFLFYDVQLLKESLAVTTVSFLLWGLVAAARGGRLGVWLAVGVGAGVLVLLRENALLVVPFLLPVAVVPGRSGALRRMTLVVAGLALVLAPVAVRNAAVGGGFLPTTFQGGVNFYIGNNASADGTYRPLTPGRQVPAFERREPVRLAEQALGRELTGAEVSRYWLGESLDWARSRPFDFLELQARKLGMFWRWYEWPDAVDYYWMASISPLLALPLLELGGVMLLALAGLWLVRRRLVVWSPVLLFAVGWTLSTVVFFVFSRYRLPVVPALLLLAAVPVAELVEGFRTQRRRSAILGALVLIAFAAPAMLSPEPRLDLVHYNLGILAERDGRIGEAAAELERALNHNPELFSAALERGNLARRVGDLGGAIGWYRRATEIEPRSALAWSNLGAALMLSRDETGAAEALGKAVEIDPTELGALTNLAVLRARRGEIEEAGRLVERVLAIDPAYRPARSLQRRLDAEEGAER